jgi:hypothetical protein
LSGSEKNLVDKFIKNMSMKAITLICRFDEVDLKKPKKNLENNLNKAR